MSTEGSEKTKAVQFGRVIFDPDRIVAFREGTHDGKPIVTVWLETTGPYKGGFAIVGDGVGAFLRLMATRWKVEKLSSDTGHPAIDPEA